MIKIHEVIKGEDYYTLTFSEGLDAYGVIITLMPEQPVYIEFMEFAKNKQDIIVITEEESPEEFKRLKEKYFDKIMAYIKERSN
jgi:hypothetical protein